MSILTVCAVAGEELPSAGLEALAAARHLADAMGDGEVQTLLLGAEVAHHGVSLIQRGADMALVSEDPRLETLDGELVLSVVAQAVERVSPDIILFPHTELLGGYVAPRLARQLETGIATDCTGYEVENGAIEWVRPVYGGKALAVMTITGPFQMATMRSLAYEPLAADAAREGSVRELPIDLAEVEVKVPIVDTIVHEQAFEGPSLDRADVIVSGGRGLGDEENFENVKELARVLDAAVGGSRPAADSGWVPHSRLVGQTGKIVAPQLYIAIGISGAPQHMSGAGSSKTIVAVNKDEDAPIFKAAHVGVVDEWENVIPTLIEELKKE